MLLGSVPRRPSRLTCAAAHIEMKTWRRKPRAFSQASSPDEELHALVAPWLAADADVGITRVTAPESKHDHWSYEISLRFPKTHTCWLVQRSYADFQHFHAAIDGAFKHLLHARRIQLPKPSRLTWAQSARAAAADKLRQQLNSYLHKLLEIESVHASDAFRDFVTPRPETNDSEIVQDDEKLEVFSRPMTRTSSTTSTSTTLSARDSVDGLLDLPMPFPWRVPPPVVAPSRCDELVHFGGTIGLTALGGLAVGLIKRSALSGSQKVAAVAAGVAGVALTGPLSAVFALSALGGGVGKYQLNKASYLNLVKPHAMEDHAEGVEFVVENAEQFSGPRRVARFGDAIHLYCHKVRKSVRVAAPPDSKRGHAMAAGADSCKTTLRLLSPYGHTGPLKCGSLVFMQLMDGEWAGQLLGAHGDCIAATKYSPAVFQLGLVNDGHDGDNCVETTGKSPAQTALAKRVEAPVPALPPRSTSKSFKLRVMVYNVWLFPSIVHSFNDKVSPWASQRAAAIPRCIAPHDVDVVIFCEAFCSSAREKLVAGMKTQGFIYETKVVGSGASLLASKKALDGGCFAMSKYPLSHCEEFTFGSVATGDDRMADKGVVYFQARVPVKAGSEATQTVHVVGTHLQAWESPVAVATRNAQLVLMRQFIDSLDLPKDEAVIFAGDMNVNKHTEQPSGEYAAMLEILGAYDPQLLPRSPAFSFDPVTNALAVDGPSSGGVTERLDYVMLDKRHRQPLVSSTEIVQLKATKHWSLPRGVSDEVLVDLSDHFPVIADLHF